MTDLAILADVIRTHGRASAEEFAQALAEKGLCIVPKVATQEMLDAGQHANSEWLNDNAPIGEHLYRAPAKSVWEDMVMAGAVAP